MSDVEKQPGAGAGAGAGDAGWIQGSDLATLMTHPVRARILAAMLGRKLTTHQIAALLPDVPLPSLYRHVRSLAEAGVLTVAEEVRVHGAATRVYMVDLRRSRITGREIESASRADQLRYFTAFLEMLADRYRDYLEHEGGDPAKEPHHALMVPLNLSPDEHPAFVEALNTFLEPWRALPPDGDRRRVIFAHIGLPDRADPPRDG